ncbi:IS3 family transposase [Lentilactobacillus diolivorans]|nr:IS3 family transposase [Lentilactobacillus diolivorans]MDH5106393.1 IS3 family transposase [Lentilactobacillus diolivorans]
MTLIRQIRKENNDYGYRRVTGALRAQGVIVNKKRVQRIMAKLGMQVKDLCAISN